VSGAAADPESAGLRAAGQRRDLPLALTRHRHGVHDKLFPARQELSLYCPGQFPPLPNPTKPLLNGAPDPPAWTDCSAPRARCLRCGASGTFALGISDSGLVAGYWDLLDANFNYLAIYGFT